jgi:hypothetical protein
MNWGDNAAQNRKTIDGHCEYKYLAHVEGGSYSGRLKCARFSSTPKSLS